LTHGNVNLFILFLIVAALFAFTRGKDRLAGLLLALSIACKVTPALFVPYLLWKRAWRTLAATAAGLVLFLFVVPALRFGWQQNQTYLTTWYKVMVHPYVVEGKVTSEHQNQSLPGLATRLLTKAPSFTVWQKDHYEPVEYHNIAELSPGTLKWLLKGCMGLFALAVIWRCRTPLAERRDWRWAAEFGIVMLGMLIFSERTWKHHAVTLLVPFAVLSYVLATQALSKLTRGYVIGTLVAVALLMLSTSTGVFDSQDRFGKVAQAYGAYVWAFFLLAAALFVVVSIRPARAVAGSSGDPALAPTDRLARAA
jgi:hypothetical protein